MLKIQQLSPDQLDVLRGTEFLDAQFWWQIRGCPECLAEILDSFVLGLLLRRKPRRVAGPHLDANTIAGLADGTLDFELLPSVLHHLARCDRCLAEIGDVRLALAGAEQAARAQRLNLDDPRLERSADALLGEPQPRRLGRLSLRQTAAGAVARFLPLVRMRAENTLEKLRRAYQDTLQETAITRNFDSFFPMLRDNALPYLEKHARERKLADPTVFASRTPKGAKSKAGPVPADQGEPSESRATGPVGIQLGMLFLRITAAGTTDEPQLELHLFQTYTGIPAPGIYLNLEADQKVISSTETDEKGRCTLPLLPGAKRLRIETDEGTWTLDL